MCVKVIASQSSAVFWTQCSYDMWLWRGAVRNDIIIYVTLCFCNCAGGAKSALLYCSV